MNTYLTIRGPFVDIMAILIIPYSKITQLCTAYGMGADYTFFLYSEI